jgi:hypothetical protein
LKNLPTWSPLGASARRGFAVTPLAAACLALLAGGAAQAQGTVAPAAEAPQKIVVTGIRGSLE